MSKFTITFNRKIQEVQKEKILDLLEINLRGSLYKDIERIGNDRLVIEGEFYSFMPSKNVPWNLWTGFSKRTEITIFENEIRYRLDYTYAVISLLLSSVFILLFLTIAFYILEFSLSFIVYCFLVLFAIQLVGIVYGIITHRRLFINTLKYGSRYKGTYDWNRILKTKSITELESIANGNTTLTEEVQELAKKELAIRQKMK
jgi:VIT1/CCC1 family predicted Fe2+/Mn2+ transporter